MPNCPQETLNAIQFFALVMHYACQLRLNEQCDVSDVTAMSSPGVGN